MTCGTGPEGARCKCGYLKETCRKSPENSSTDFRAYCKGDKNP